MRNALPKGFQELFVVRWAKADEANRAAIEQEAQDTWAYLLEGRDAYTKLERSLRDLRTTLERFTNPATATRARTEFYKAGKARGEFKVRSKGEAALRRVMDSWRAQVRELEERQAQQRPILELAGLLKTAEPPRLTPEQEAEVFAIDHDPLGLDFEEELGEPDKPVTPTAAEQAVAPTRPEPELEKTIVARYHREAAAAASAAEFQAWMLSALREAGPATQKRIEAEAVAGLSEPIVAQQTPEALAAAYVVAKTEQDRQVAALESPAAAPEKVDLDKTKESTVEEPVVGAAFAAEVTRVAAKEQPTSWRRFLPRFVAERLQRISLRGVAKGGELGEAWRFRRETNAAAREFLESVQDRLLFGEGGTSHLVDGALTTLRERLGKLTGFSGEGMGQRLAAKESELRQLLERELRSSTGLLHEREIEALGEQLRDNLDRNYWLRYVVGGVELAVAAGAGAAGGALALKGFAFSRAKRELRGATTRAVVRRVTGFRGVAAPRPDIAPGSLDEVAAHGSIDLMVRRTAARMGKHLTRGQLNQIDRLVARSNDISVKAWGIPGRIKDTAMPDGMLLRGVHAAIKQIVG
ncbi:MAG: hypothetical protein U0514_02060 [Candidatus Andersenbacteria bacterium]